MSFLETPTFPLCPRLGYTASPRYSVTISETASAKERRNRNWARPLYVYTVTIGPNRRDEEELVEELMEFWHAMGGTECGFRFKDWSDYKSCRKFRDVSRTDQFIIATVDSPAGLQMVKTYQFGTRQQVRKILKPVDGTILVADNGVLKTEGADYQIDYATGLVTLSFSPVGQLTWGGEFDVPVRFDSEFPVEIAARKIESVSFQLKEIRDPETED